MALHLQTQQKFQLPVDLTADVGSVASDPIEGESTLTLSCASNGINNANAGEQAKK